MTNGSMTDRLTRSREALDQPSLSARAFEPFTRQLFLEAGLRTGARVLDIFSGAGDVALLARDIVGPSGEVIGFDQNSQAVSYANERAAFRGYPNVSFVETRIDDLPSGADFDAIVGRMVLAFRRDPVRDLRALARCIRPGGLVVFQEFDLLTGRTIPPVPEIDGLRKWLTAALERIGIEVQMGPKLHAIFEEAGLPPPHMRLDGFIGGGESIAPMFLAHVLHTLLPQLDASGVEAPGDLQIDTLEERMRLHLTHARAILQSPLLIGAWARLPA